MEKFRIEKGTVTDFPISEINRLNDLALELVEKELDLKKREAKFSVDYTKKFKELEEKENKLKEDISNNASIVRIDTNVVNHYYDGSYKSNLFTDYKVIDEKFNSELRKDVEKKVYSMLDEMSFLQFRKFIKLMNK